MEELIVGLIVALAVWVVLLRYMPAVARSKLNGTIAAALTSAGWLRAARRFEASAQAGASCSDGCGSCGGCGSKQSDLAQTEFAITADALKRTARGLSAPCKTP
jgi:hypothetical protein